MNQLLMTVMSLLRREYRSLPRQPWFHLRRLILPAAGMLLFWLVFMPALQGRVPPGMRLFQLLCILTAISTFIVSMHATGQSIIRDRTHGNLELIFITDMPSWQYALGKFGYGVTRGLQVIAVLAPVAALTYGMGGYNHYGIKGAALLILVTTLLGSACGLLASAMVRDPLHIRILSALFALSLYVIVPGIAYVYCQSQEYSEYSLVLGMSPFACLWHVHNAVFATMIHMHLLGSLVVVAAIVGLSCLRIPFTLCKPEGEPDTIFGEISQDLSGTQTMRMLLDKPMIEGNPLVWRDLHVLYGGERMSWAKLVVVTVLLIGVVGAIGYFAGLPTAKIPMWVWIFTTVFYGTIFCYGLLLNASKAFDRERQDQSIDLLLTSDLTSEELIAGKLMSILHTHTPYGAGLALGLLLLLLNMSMESMAAALLGILQFTVVLVTASSISIFLAAKLKTTWNLAFITISYCIIWLGVIIAFPFSNGLPAFAILAIITVSYHGYLTFVCWRYLTANCRGMLLDIPMDVSPHGEIDEPFSR